MLLVALAYGFIFFSAYLQLYYWCGWKKIQNNKKVRAICNVIILRTLGIILCMFALIMSERRTMFLFATSLYAFIFLMYDVWRMKKQIDETIN